MGYYIETPSQFGKARYLVETHGAKLITRPAVFPATDEALICVVGNLMFEAAGYCFDEGEFNAFASPDHRPKQWLLMDRETAQRLSGFKIDAAP